MSNDVKSRMGAEDWALLATLSLLWGGSFLFVGVAVHELPPLTIVALRVSLAAFVLHLVLRAVGLPFPRTREVWAAFLGMGVLNNAIPFSLIVWGQTQIASGLASILNATTPLFTVLVAHAFTRDERLTPLRGTGVIVGFIGVVAMVGPAALQGLGSEVAAQLAVLAAAVSYAFAGVFGRRFKRLGVPPLATAAGQVTASGLVLVPIALAVERPWALAWPSAVASLSILALALLSTAVAYILYFRLLASAGATNLLLVTFLIPASAVALGALLLGERLEPKHLVGMALIGVGLACIDGRLPAQIRALGPASSGSG